MRRIISSAGTAVGICLLALCSACAGSSTGMSTLKDTAAETALNDLSGIDIVEAVIDEQNDKTSLSQSMDENVTDAYQRVLDGISAGAYYLQDITGDGVPELIAGDSNMNVYTCEGGEIRTLGTIVGNTVYYSVEYGILTEDDGNDLYELHSYRYSDGLLNEDTVASDSDFSEFMSDISGILSSARSLTRFNIADRSVFGS